MITSSFYYIFFICLIFFVQAPASTLENRVLNVDADAFYDPNANDEHFSGRVTDRDESGQVLKISSENKNIRFFKAGDQINFKIDQYKLEAFCKANVRSVEEKYIVIFVTDFSPCFPGNDYFRRGTALIFKSERLKTRVKEASIYRAMLIDKKSDYLTQLNQLNKDLFTVEEKKLKVASEYDQKILELEKEKQKAIEQVLNQNLQHVRLQKELSYRLDGITKELDFYRIDREQPLFDRWHLDRDSGAPVLDGPVALKNRE